MKKKVCIGIIAISTILVILSSCSTLGKEDKIYSTSIVLDNIKTIDNVEKDIIKQYKENNPLEIASIKENLDNLTKQESSDFDFLATVNALYADYFFLTGSKLKAKKILEKAKVYNQNNELVVVVSSKLMDFPEEKIDFLKNYIEKNSSVDSYRALVALGLAYYEHKDYTNALVAFDSALDFLPQEYRELYNERREHCKKFYKVDSNIKSAASEIIKKEKILLYEMTQLTQDETDTLDFITGTEKWKPLMLAEKLKANGWYSDEANLKKDTTDRKDAALFLWHLIAGNDSEKLSKYSRKFIAQKRKSPIKDVEIDGMYFDAIIGNIEEDIIPLIDGIEFKPNKPVSGLEFYNWLNKTKNIAK